NELVTYGSDAWTGGHWRKRGSHGMQVQVGTGNRIPFVATQLESPDIARARVVWQTYSFGSRITTSAYAGKLLEAWRRLADPGRPAFEILLSADGANAGELLERFASTELASLLASLHGPSGMPAGRNAP
ncbi:MAG TPA: exosortase-associated EpsI family protein, partial [Steroidobacteraceae bacterium]|nr:exosortase-associated EpsI family protein [Steroidobacteraceae bacterium]